MIFADKDLAMKLERAEGQACREFAEARAGLFPECGSEWMECAGTTVVFDGVGSPTTQTFGLGLGAHVDEEVLGTIERFFFERGTAAVHEVCPAAGVDLSALLCERGYRPVEFSSVLYCQLLGRTLDGGGERYAGGPVRVRTAGQEDAGLWVDVSARGWGHAYPELGAMMREMGTVAFARAGSVAFLAEFDGVPGAAGALCLHGGVALFGGASTVPEMRQRGLQSALFAERLRYAMEHGYGLAMMVAEVGSQSQRNAERAGFRVAYTRTKYSLSGDWARRERPAGGDS